MSKAKLTKTSATLTKTVLCLSLLLLGMVFGEYIHVFELAGTSRTLQDIIDDPESLPIEILYILVLVSVVLGCYLVYLIINGIELRQKKTLPDVKCVKCNAKFCCMSSFLIHRLDCWNGGNI